MNSSSAALGLKLWRREGAENKAPKASVEWDGESSGLLNLSAKL